MAAPPDLVLDPDERRLLERGVGEFNRGFFFECHDTLEELWSGLRGEGRGFVQGLIQVAVAFYHLGNANPAGATSLLRRALARFAPYPSPYSGFDLDAHRADLERWLARVEAGAPDGITLESLPKWTFGEGGPGPGAQASRVLPVSNRSRSRPCATRKRRRGRP